MFAPADRPRISAKCTRVRTFPLVVREVWVRTDYRPILAARLQAGCALVRGPSTWGRYNG